MLSSIRHDDIFPKSDHLPVHLIGLGAVGSRVAATLIELGVEPITAYDFDAVESHNLANQLYTAGDVGSSKIVALRRWAERKVGGTYPIELIHSKVTPEQFASMTGIVFLMVDSLASRRAMAEALRDAPNPPSLVIDTRMSAAHGNVFTFDVSKLDRYLATLGSDDDAEVSGCGSPYSVAPTAAIIANLAVWTYIHACQFILSPTYTLGASPTYDERLDVYLKPVNIGIRSL